MTKETSFWFLNPVTEKNRSLKKNETFMNVDLR